MHGVTVSMLVARILHTIFGDDGEFNMLKTGVLLRHGGESVFVKMEFDAMPEDALAHKHVWNLKGASAKAPCPECCNCMGRCPRFELDPDGYVHVLSPDYGRCVPRTRARFFEMADDI